ncbi:MAG: hypothetical protein RL653_1584 [Pseudomonadota bacterium]|jgi:hypothetical protein
MRHRLPSVQPAQVRFRAPYEGTLVHAAVFVSWPQGACAPLLELRVRVEDLEGLDGHVPLALKQVLLHVAGRVLRLPLRWGEGAWRQRGEWLCCALGEVEVEPLLHALRRPRPRRSSAGAPPATA